MSAPSAARAAKNFELRFKFVDRRRLTRQYRILDGPLALEYFVNRLAERYCLDLRGERRAALHQCLDIHGIVPFHDLNFAAVVGTMPASAGPLVACI